MRIKVLESSVSVWVAATETYAWARRPGESWPCSTLSGHRVFAEFDENGLLDMTVDGRYRDCDGSEFNAMMSDCLKNRIPENHPVWFIAVGQFLEGASA